MHFVTGATGLLGSHLAERLVGQGERVRALVRPHSDKRFLRKLGVELWPGDLNDPTSLHNGLRGVRLVYHAAAKVGDWGTPAEFRRHGVEGTRQLLEACTAAGVERLIHISSISAYGHPPPRPEPITETEPLGTRFWLWDHYTRSKVDTEHLVWGYHHKTGLPLTVIRPSWIYGPRDRTSIFRLAWSLRNRRMQILGDGTNRLNSVYAGNVAHACLLAARLPQAAGQAYNITNDGHVTQQEYLNLFADALGYPRPTRHLPYGPVFAAVFFMEAVHRLLRTRKPPFATRYATWLIGRSTYYSSEKAERELGWRPQVGYAEGIRLTAEWYLHQARNDDAEPLVAHRPGDGEGGRPSASGQLTSVR
jgi:nucleoside-diphosphate-sugar epimerase